jgi:hypothetical protein
VYKLHAKLEEQNLIFYEWKPRSVAFARTRISRPPREENQKISSLYLSVEQLVISSQQNDLKGL